MSRNIISTFTAAAMSMSIALAVPVAVTAVSSVTVVSEAQAGLWSKTKRVAKRKYNKAKRRVIGAKDIVAGNRCKGGSWVGGNHGICGFSVDPINGAHRTVKRKSKSLGKACVKLGGCQGTITGVRNIHDHRTN